MTEPPIGSLVRDRDGELHERTEAGWRDGAARPKAIKSARTFVGSWAEFLRWYGPITVHSVPTQPITDQGATMKTTYTGVLWTCDACGRETTVTEGKAPLGYTGNVLNTTTMAPPEVWEFYACGDRCAGKAVRGAKARRDLERDGAAVDSAAAEGNPS